MPYIRVVWELSFFTDTLLCGGSVVCAGNNRPSSPQTVWHVTAWKARVKNDVNNGLNNEFHLAASVSGSWYRGSVSHCHVLLGLLNRTEPSWLLSGTPLFFFSDCEKSKMYQSFSFWHLRLQFFIITFTIWQYVLQKIKPVFVCYMFLFVSKSCLPVTNNRCRTQTILSRRLMSPLNITPFFFFFFLTHSLCLCFTSSGSLKGRWLLLLPRAGCLLKVDSSSRWVTNAGAEAWPSEGEEGRTKYISVFKVKSCDSHIDGNSTGTRTWLSASLFIIYIISSEIRAEKNQKKPAD